MKPSHLAGLFEYLFMFWLHRHLPAKQALNSKQSIKGYKRIIQEILRNPGYFNFACSDMTDGTLKGLKLRLNSAFKKGHLKLKNCSR